MDKSVKIVLIVAAALLFCVFFGNKIITSWNQNKDTDLARPRYDTITRDTSAVFVANQNPPITEQPAKQADNSLSLSLNLAIDDNGGNYVADTSINVIKIKLLLNKMAGAYKLPVDTVARFINNTRYILHQKGVSDTNLNILHQMDLMGKHDGVKLNEALALYGVLKANQEHL